MNLSITELELISERGRGNATIADLSKKLSRSSSQVYRITQKLQKKGLITNKLDPEQKTHVNLLIRTLSRAKNLAEPLSGTGMQIYTALQQPKTVKDLEKETKLHKTTILKKIKQGRKMSLILKEKTKYCINEKIWPDLKEYLTEYKKYEEALDARIPATATIYFKNEKEILFSTQDQIDAEETGFSAYERHGLGLLLVKPYYALPKRRLTKKDVFIHSLQIVEKEPDVRYFIMIILFYAKYRQNLSGIEHPILDTLLKILAGETLENYPTRSEILERADIYKLREAVERL